MCGPEGFPRKHNKKKQIHEDFTRKGKGNRGCNGKHRENKKVHCSRSYKSSGEKGIKTRKGANLTRVLTLGFAAWWALLPRQVLHQPWACLDTHYVSLIRDIFAAKQTEAQSILTQSGMCEQEIKKAIEEVCRANPLEEIGREGEGRDPLKQFPKGLRTKTLAVNIAAYMLTLKGSICTPRGSRK